MPTIASPGLNDLSLEAPTDRLTELVLDVTAGRVTKAAVAVFMKDHLRPR